MKNNINKYITIILGIYIFWLGLVPLFCSSMLKIISENLSHNSDYNINLENPRIITSILPTITFKADSLSIHEKKDNDNLNIVKPKIKIRLLPLLSGHFHINKISASEININSKLNEIPKLDKKFLTELKKEKFVCDSISTGKFKIILQHPQDTFNFDGKNIYYRKNGRFIKISIDCNINSKNEKSEIFAKLYLPRNNDILKSEANINVKNLNIKPITDFMRNFLPQDFKDASGIININLNKNHMTSSFNNCTFLMQDDAKSIVFPEELNLNSDFNITRKNITIDFAELTSKNINTNFSGTISNYLEKSQPAVNIDIHVNKSRVEDFISMLPAFKTEDIDVYKLKKYKFYGDAIGNLNITGDNLEPSLTGNIFINNGILTKPIPNAGGASIKIKLLGKYLTYDVIVPAGKSEKVWVKGGVEIYNVKYADMRVWSTQKVDLQTAEEKVVPIHEILNFVIGPVPIMDIKGDGNIDITVKGNRQNPHVWGGLNFNNVKTYFTDIPNLVLDNAVAVLTFDDENAVFGLKKGEVNGKKINIDGTCNLSGKFDFNVSTDNQEISYLYNAITTSSNLIDDVKAIIPKLSEVSGPNNLKLKVYGNIKNIELLKFNKNFFTKGTISLLGNSFVMDGVKIHNTKGELNFDGTNADAKINAYIGNSPLTAGFNVKNNIADVNVEIPHLNLCDILTKNFKSDFSKIITSVSLQYKGKINDIEYDKVNFTAKILGNHPKNKMQLSNGEVTLKKGRLNISDLNGYITKTSHFNVNLTADNIGSSPRLDGDIKLKDFELALINTFCEYAPENIKTIVNKIKFQKGKINLNASIRNNNVNASTNLGGVEFVYTPQNMPIKIVNGSVFIKNNSLGLNKINMLADNMPILADGKVNDIFKKKEFNIYLNSKPQQEFINKYFNNNRLYPLKLKGDIICQMAAKGTPDNFNLSLQTNLEKDSSIYYLGAMVGDIENALVLNLNIDVIKQNILKIKEFSYDKLIQSQGSKITKMNMLKAYGGIDIDKEDFIFHDLRIKTQNPTDARIFNIIFRKPNIKQGQFTSDLKFNGNSSNPKLSGIFHIFEANIPFLDTSMKNISLKFKEKTIDISSIGEVFGNEIRFKGTLKNSLVPPFYIENAEIYTKEIDLNYITERLKIAQVDDYQGFETLNEFKITDLIIKNLKMTSNIIQLRNLVAQNVEASASINDKNILNINNFKFNIANGSLSGNASYNLKNNNTGINLDAKNIDANSITYALFDLKNQLYGDLTGNIKLSCNGSDFDKCMETLNGSTSFNVNDGKMPKLGSLEYLLRAGNLLKGGVTSLSINSVIDIISPLKTGNFSNIYGTINIKDGIAENIEISTKGKDLSLFIFGNYNFSTAEAEMEVLGILSRNISTMFGPLGNVSINTLFNVIPGVDLSKDSKLLEKINKIPGIELSGKAYRKFVSEIKGNINGDNYVSSFKWIN